MIKVAACPACGGDVVGRRDKKWCSEKCRSGARDKHDYNAQYYAANKGRLNAANTEWKAANRDHVNRERRKWVAANKDAVTQYRREYQRGWYPANRHRQLDYQSRRRALKRQGGAFDVTPRDYRRALGRCRGLCVYCGARIATEWDHVVPLSRGGHHSVGNLAAACATCNRSKGALLVTEWRKRTAADASFTHDKSTT